LEAHGFSENEETSKIVVDTNMLRNFISEVRALKAKAGAASQRDGILYFAPNSSGYYGFLNLAANQADKYLPLIGVKQIIAPIIPNEVRQSAMASATSSGTIYYQSTGTVDKGAERVRLGKELANLDKVIASSEARLANEAFTSKAPANVIEGAKKQLAENQAKREELKRLLTALG
jgi:valyl-tRNA synthetase